MKRKRNGFSKFQVYQQCVQQEFELIFIRDVTKIVVSYLPGPGYLDWQDPKSSEPLPSNDIIGSFRFGNKYIISKKTQNETYLISVFNSKFQQHPQLIRFGGPRCSNELFQVNAMCCSNSKYIFCMRNLRIEIYEVTTTKKYYRNMSNAMNFGDIIAASDSHLFIISGNRIQAFLLADVLNENAFTSRSMNARCRHVLTTPNSIVGLCADEIFMWQGGDTSWHFIPSVLPQKILGYWNNIIYVLCDHSILSINIKLRKEITSNPLPSDYNKLEHKIAICGNRLWILNEKTRTSFLLS